MICPVTGKDCQKCQTGCAKYEAWLVTARTYEDDAFERFRPEDAYERRTRAYD